MTPGRWWSANLCRWKSSTLQPVGGWSRLATSYLSSAPRAITQWVASAGVRSVAIGTDSGFSILQGNTLTDITPTGFNPDAGSLTAGGYGTWNYGEEAYGTGRSAGTPAYLLHPNYISMAPWGEDMLMLSSHDGRLYYWDSSVGGQATLVAPDQANSPVPVSNRGMAVFDRFCVLIGANGDPRQVAWSQREDFRDWKFDNVTGTEGFQSLDSYGELCAIKVVSEGLLLFSETNVWLMRFIGDPYIFSITPIQSDSSLVCPYAVTTFDGKAVWQTRRGFMLYNSGQVTPLPCEIGDFVNNDRDEFWGRIRTHASTNGVYPECWFFYPSVGSSEADSYVIWNYEENLWVPGKMSRSAASGGSVNYYPLMGSADGAMWSHENGSAFSSAGAGPIYIESGAVEPSPGQVVQIHKLLADSGFGPQASSFTFYVSFTPDGAETVKGPYIARADGYTDLRMTGRYIRIRIQQRQDGDWTVGNCELDVIPRGTR